KPFRVTLVGPVAYLCSVIDINTESDVICGSFQHVTARSRRTVSQEILKANGQPLLIAKLVVGLDVNLVLKGVTGQSVCGEIVLSAWKIRHRIGILKKQRCIAEPSRIHDVQLAAIHEGIANEASLPIRPCSEGIKNLALQDRPSQPIGTNLWTKYLGEVSTAHFLRRYGEDGTL